MSYVLTSQSRARERDGLTGRYMPERDELAEQQEYLRDRENPLIIKMRLDNAKASLRDARLERIRKYDGAYFGILDSSRSLPHPYLREDALEQAAAYRIAAIVLSRQVIAHLPR